ncbi:MBL fold metallo-hydrolase [Pseudonocardia cypriaca]|uniref:MBL fold metallo-hydrolase n=1 Tax=Pseudonocardia cypriaca TaxID=882449 RepID=UPI001B8610BA|nr:MBL fold metallo-hydrolase [Pseudonocardia cypriaca]
MEITFVGSGDAFGSGGRFQTCIRLRVDGGTALVDCGATSLTAMRAQGVDPGEVAAVVVTHLHGDHFGGLPFLVLDGQFTRRTAPLTVFGPVGTGDRLHTAMETFYPGSTGVRRRFEVEVVELDGAGGADGIGPFSVRSWEVDHASGAPALAVRLDADGHGFGYSGDTAWTPALVSGSRGRRLRVRGLHVGPAGSLPPRLQHPARACWRAGGGPAGAHAHGSEDAGPVA